MMRRDQNSMEIFFLNNPFLERYLPVYKDKIILNLLKMKYQLEQFSMRIQCQIFLDIFSILHPNSHRVR